MVGLVKCTQLFRKANFNMFPRHGKIFIFFRHQLNAGFSTHHQTGTRKTTVKVLGILAGLGFTVLSALKIQSLLPIINCEENLAKGPKREENDALSLSKAIDKSRDLLQRIKDETGSPGIVVGVSVNGKDVWKEGLGYSDLENRTHCTAATVFRIASISKAITMGMVAKLWEQGDLDLDKPINHYLPQYPVQTFNGEKVEITTRQLVSHLAGIRHYNKDYIEKNKEKKENSISVEDRNNEKSKLSQEKSKGNSKKADSDNSQEKSDGKSKKSEAHKKKTSEFENKEYYIRKHYDSVTESLTLFQQDPLVHKPGSKFLYTSHGWTVVSAVMEKAANKPFDKMMLEYFKTLSLRNTYLEYNDPLVYYRGRHYIKNEKGRIVNAPYVDNSYKWAGGGYISNVTDILRYGNIMLYSYQKPEPTENETKGDNLEQDSTKRQSLLPNDTKGANSKDQKEKLKSTDCTKGHNSQTDISPGYLKKDTMDMIFTPVEKTECSWDLDGSYGMGWAVVPEKCVYGYCKQQRHYVSHTGGAVGASSVLLILPCKKYGKLCQPSIDGKYGKLSQPSIDGKYGNQCVPPQGIIVALITNLGSVGLNSVALEIAKIFESVNL